MAVALVTGAARPRGIGRAVALRLAADGHDVACVDIAGNRPDPAAPAVPGGPDLDAVVAEIRGLGRRALAVSADISDEDQVEAAVERASTDLGPISLVANVAGGTSLGFGIAPLVEVAAAEFRRVVEVNLVGTWLVSRACARRMLAAGIAGRICNTSSQASKVGFVHMGAYSAAKAGVNLLTQVLAKELGPHGIAVNAVCPGTVDTEPTRQIEEHFVGGPDAVRAYIEREIPLQRVQTAEEIAAAVSWLLSPDAAGLTGEAVNVSAGQTMV
ncbi:SDR family NAD(P)-dependent oxidoreductase [Pseudonocardia sp. CA-107938]|uniref:SDR family NAD(P)-dependent oxidoreductase n=1 Tax=Pseudonocardia sp. CA-107938 TaxID=3240021 RepID=UPI003D902C7E